jgi:hypothetical protein
VRGHENKARSTVVQLDIVNYRRLVPSRRTLGRAVFLSVLASNSSALLAAASDALIDRMAKTYVFAFGGVGIGLATSQGESDHRVLLSQASAATDFERLFAVGNPQAKCYALVGLRQTNPKRFEALATSLQSSRIPVQVMRGCLMYEDPMSEIIKSIRAGIYSGPLTRGLIPANENGATDGPRTSSLPVPKEESWIDFIRRIL